MDDSSVNRSLNDQIHILRMKMVSIGTQKGFTDPETVKYSEELDKLILLFQLKYSK
ncbi:aspartyl-phosphate phosphatase Spo0E family protein [Bacillus sp. NTK074B]|uniref:aspartyl-phosphate phosphatase Spo0E family protein n=1 Tax=Bacillus sp. NTK074B TaxID=2802174 RepID=UPI001A8C84AD|nr:aspartyl-phosphate phosphatase Spo0E family protein [Bacillus sp. NTK074B]